MAAPIEPSNPLTNSMAPTAGSEIPQLPPDATPEQKDLHWFKYVYQGDRMPQLTWRAVIMGGFLGMVMSAANLYTTLSIGWAFGIAITACVLSFVMWNFVRLCAGNRVSQMSVLENACMASCASAAGYSTGSTIATMFGALVLLYDVPAGKTAADVHTWDVTAPWILVLFTLCTGLMGVFLAIPMKRQQINHEQLPFPSGIAAAETLRSLYSESKEAIKKAYVLVYGLAAGLIIGFLRAGDDILEAIPLLKKLFSVVPRIPEKIDIFVFDRLYPGMRHASGFAFEPSALLIAAGMIVGMRTSISLVVSSLVLYLGVGPYLANLDAAHFERPAALVMTSAAAAAKDKPDPASAAAAAVDAIAQSAASLGLAEAEFRKSAQAAAEAQIKAFQPPTEEEKKEHPGDVRVAKVWEPKLGEGFGKAIGAAVADKAAKASANLPAEKAANEAEAAAKAAGKTTEAEVAAARAAAYDAAKYRPNVIWNWGGNEITITRWSLWGGTAIMVFASLTSVALQYRTIARAFLGMRSAASEEEAGHNEKLKAIEVPASWMFLGMAPITIAMVWLQYQAFGVTWYAGLIAVMMSFVLSLVASRATGETDTTPIGAMGKVMQLMFAVLAPKNITANLASAGIAANSASSSADLLTDLKTGYLLGANPRKQFLAQFFGVFFGTVAIVPIWYLMVPTREKLEAFALPSTRAWEAVARVLVKGVSELPPSAIYAIFIGAAVGIALPVIERLLPAKYRQYMPSATGVGLAWVMPFQNAFSFFVGAVIALFWGKVGKKSCERYNVPLASGLIAGESLMAAGLAIVATILGIGHMKGWW